MPLHHALLSNQAALRGPPKGAPHTMDKHAAAVQREEAAHKITTWLLANRPIHEDEDREAGRRTC